MILSMAATLFFGLAPLILGSIIDLGIIKPTVWFANPRSWVDSKDATLDWILGGLVIFVWVQFCRFGLVAQQVWRFFTFAPNPPGNNLAAANNNQANDDLNDAAHLPAPAEDDELAHVAERWYGENGRTERFFSVLQAALVEFEYDEIDPVILLDEVCYPMVKGLMAILFWPLFCLGAIELRAPVMGAMARMLVVRTVLVFGVAHQTRPIWRERAMKVWKDARKAARDDLYLIGEMLMSYAG